MSRGARGKKSNRRNKNEGDRTQKKKQPGYHQKKSLRTFVSFVGASALLVAQPIFPIGQDETLFHTLDRRPQLQLL